MDGWPNQVGIRLTQLSTGLKVEAELGNSEYFTKPVESFGIDISKCFSFSENMAYFIAFIVDFSTSY